MKTDETSRPVTSIQVVEETSSVASSSTAAAIVPSAFGVESDPASFASASALPWQVARRHSGGFHLMAAPFVSRYLFSIYLLVLQLVLFGEWNGWAGSR